MADQRCCRVEWPSSDRRGIRSAYLTSTPQFHVPNTTFPAGSGMFAFHPGRHGRDTASSARARSSLGATSSASKSSRLAAAPRNPALAPEFGTPITILVGIDSQEGAAILRSLRPGLTHGAAFVTAAHARTRPKCWKSSDGRDSSARVGSAIRSSLLRGSSGRDGWRRCGSARGGSSRGRGRRR